MTRASPPAIPDTYSGEAKIAEKIGQVRDLYTIIGLHFLCIGLTVYILKNPKLNAAKKLFFFDFFRYSIHLAISNLWLMPMLNKIAPKIFKDEPTANLTEWLIWWFGYPLAEFTQIDGVMPQDIVMYTGVKIPHFISLGLVTELGIDYLWAFKNLKLAKTVRTGWYGIWLFMFTAWFLVALARGGDVPLAQDYRNKLMFMEYWNWEPWVVAVVLYGLFFSVWLPTIVTGMLIREAIK